MPTLPIIPVVVLSGFAVVSFLLHQGVMPKAGSIIGGGTLLIGYGLLLIGGFDGIISSALSVVAIVVSLPLLSITLVYIGIFVVGESITRWGIPFAKNAAQNALESHN